VCRQSLRHVWSYQRLTLLKELAWRHSYGNDRQRKLRPALFPGLGTSLGRSASSTPGNGRLYRATSKMPSNVGGKMGTSQSSGGPPSGMPMVPPWVPDPPDGELPLDSMPPPADGENPVVPPNQPTVPLPFPPIPIAPSARFGPTRLNLGKFALSTRAKLHGTIT
jgi:hypothetical protein